MVKQKSSNKKKGPKGKKARAKAKLDKQWGETAIIDDEKPRRLGKSRLKTQLRTQDSGKAVQWTSSASREPDILPETTMDEGYSAPSASGNQQDSKQKSSLRKGRLPRHEYVSDSEEADSEDEEAPALQGLLEAIRKAKRADSIKQPMKKGITSWRNKMAQDDPASGVEMKGFDDLSTSESESEPGDSDIEENAGDDSVEIHLDDDDDDRNMDLFYQHFNRKPLSSEQLQDSSSVSRKIKIDSKTEFCVSTSQSIEVESPFSSTTTVDELKDLAEASFKGNRKVLKTMWTKLSKRQMTERQALIYPFLTRYMDMLITTESRKVRLVVEQT